MLNTNQKSKPRRRRQPGQGVAPELVSWLNAGQETDRVVALLEVALRSPVFLFTRTSYLEDGTPAEYVKSVYPGDRYKIVNRLMRLKRIRV